MIRLVVLLSLVAATVMAQEWRELTPTGAGPTPRTHPSSVYDEARHRMVVFGGRSAQGYLDEMWILDLNTMQWAQVVPQSGPTPPPRSTHNAVYDGPNDRFLVWSGRLANDFYNDVWSFDLANQVWTELLPDGPIPNMRYGTAAIMDPLAGNLVTFAGFTNEGRFDDTWRFDPGVPSWIDLGLSANPGRRCLHSASYDARDHRMVIYGGQRDGPLGDLWALDLNTQVWTELTPADSPRGRTFPVTVYDELGHRFWVFGGATGGAKQDNAWSYDFNEGRWTLLETDGPSPPARSSATGIYIKAENRAIIFGGETPSVRLNDVWALENLSPGETAVEVKSWGQVKKGE